MSFIFGGDTGETQESIKRRRRIAEMLSGQGAAMRPRNVGDALSMGGKVLGGAIADRGVRRKEQALEEQERSRIAEMLTGNPEMQKWAEPLLGSEQGRDAITRMLIDANAPLSKADQAQIDMSQARMDQADRHFGMSHGLAQERLGMARQAAARAAQPKPFEPASMPGKIISDARAMLASGQITREQAAQMIRNGLASKQALVNVNSGPQGKLPAGWQFVQSPDGQFIAQPIPGGPADQERQDAAAQSAERQAIKQRGGDVVVEDIGRALEMIEENPALTVGIGAAALNQIPGTDARDVRGLIDTIKANTGFDKLQQMRDASPTGGALGQVSEFENRLLQSVIGNLEQDQSRAQLEYNLKRVRRIYNEIVHGPGGAQKSDPTPQAPNEAPQAAPQTPQGGWSDDKERRLQELERKARGG